MTFTSFATYQDFVINALFLGPAGHSLSFADVYEN